MTKRIRVFAGPNGSGKSSIIKSIITTKVADGKTLDFGIYVNADDIAVSLNKSGCNFDDFKVQATKEDILWIANYSGLINETFSLDRFTNCILVEDNHLKIDKDVAEEKDDSPVERVAQIIADYLRKKLLKKGEKFSFETVFSHKSKVDIIREAEKEGYKVYLYFISTEHPDINVYRVKIVRVGKKGHDVDETKIRERYYRSMELMYEAAQHCYQAYFFDNSRQGEGHTMFAHFKINKDGIKLWDNMQQSSIPVWFRKYYSDKVKEIKKNNVGH
ncbi:MAG: hypothetical protein WCP85_31035 [Mariniphaga sp.]